MRLTSCILAKCTCNLASRQDARSHLFGQVSLSVHTRAHISRDTNKYEGMPGHQPAGTGCGAQVWLLFCGVFGVTCKLTYPRKAALRVYALGHKRLGIVKMVRVHDSRLFSPWQLQFKRRATALWLGPGIQYCAMGVYSALDKGALSTTAAHRLAYLTIDKADDHGVGGLLPAQVIPVVSVVGLEQILAELHRRPRRAIDLLGGRECCEIGALSAHADVAD